MSPAPDHPAQGVANDVAVDVVSGVVVQAGLVHGGVHVHPAAPAVGSGHPRPWLPWLVAGALLVLLTAVTVTLPVHDIIAGEPVPQPGTPPISPPATFTLSGTLTLKQASDDLRFGKPAIASTSQGCQGTGSYSDLSAGTAVIVKDPAGRQVAVGALKAGRLAEGTNSCAMTFSVPDVPHGLPSYSVTISRRGTHVSTPDQARAGIALSIGG